MKKFSIKIYHSLTSLIFISALVLTQFPIISLALDFGAFNQTDKGFTFQPPPVSFLSPQVVFTNSATISINDRASGAAAPNGISSPYPSPIAVSGLTGTLTAVTVTLNNVTLPRPNNVDIALVAPNGTAFMLVSDVNEGSPGATSNANITIADGGGSFPATGAIPGGTYAPTDVNSVAANNDAFPAPGPSSIISPAPTGTATLNGTFAGINPNGTWNLYAIDDALGGGASTIGGGWSLDITTNAAAAATATTITSSQNPSLTTQNVTFTATVTSGGSAVTAGTVSFTQNGAAIAGCTNVAVSGTGTATCTANAGTLPQGNRTITANYNGTAALGASNASLTQTVNSPTVVSGNQFCNNGGITLNDNGAASPYPANIAVANLNGTISKLTVNLNGVTVSNGQDIDLLLVGPGGRAFKILSDVGDANPSTGINLTLDDAAASALPISATLASGTFRPTDNNVAGQADTFPAPAPATFFAPAPTGAATFASVYNATNPNGNWALYARDDALGGAAGSISGVCLNFTITAPTAATVNVGGRVLTASGRGVARARVTLTDDDGNVRYAVTNPFGRYRFTDVAAGESYVIDVKSKRLRFAPQVMVINEETNALNFVASE